MCKTYFQSECGNQYLTILQVILLTILQVILNMKRTIHFEFSMSLVMFVDFISQFFNGFSSGLTDFLYMNRLRSINTTHLHRKIVFFIRYQFFYNLFGGKLLLLFNKMTAQCTLHIVASRQVTKYGGERFSSLCCNYGTQFLHFSANKIVT